MIDGVSGRQAGGAPSLALPADRAGAVDGERLALATTAAAVAMLPLLLPRGPGNVAPVDALIALTLSACLFWAGVSGRRWRFPYALAVGLLLVGGALGALAGPVPESGVVALVQDVVLLAWCWAVANVASSPEKLRVLLATWAYSSIGWALVLFGGLATGSTAVTGQTPEEGSRTALTFGDPNVSANYYVVSLMVIWAARLPRHLGWRLAASALLLAALASTGSNSGVVSLIVAVAIAAVVAIYRRVGIVPAMTALAFLALGSYVAASAISLKGIQEAAHESRYAFLRDGIGRGQTSVLQRDLLLRQSFDLYATGAPFGSGPVSTKARLEEEMAPFVKEAHNDYVAALIERGALGFLGLVVLVGSVAVHTASVVKRRWPDAFAAVVVSPGPLVGAVAGTMVAGVVYEFLHVRHVWALFAFVAAVSLFSRRRPA